jgi:hypothetical protein
VLADYCDALDKRDRARLADCFVEEAVMTAGSERFEGRPAIIARCEEQWQRRDWAQHLVGPVRATALDVTRSVATAPFHFVSRSGSGVRVCAGSYVATVASKASAYRLVVLEIQAELEWALELPGARTPR